MNNWSGWIGNQTEIDDRYCIPIPLPSAEHYPQDSVVLESSRRHLVTLPVPDLIESDSLRSWRLQLGPKFAERMLGLRQLVDDAARRAASQAERDGTRGQTGMGTREEQGMGGLSESAV